MVGHTIAWVPLRVRLDSESLPLPRIQGLIPGPYEIRQELPGRMNTASRDLMTQRNHPIRVKESSEGLQLE